MDSIIPPGTVEYHGGDLSLHICIVIFFILLNAFFAMAESAVISVNDIKLKKLAENGNRRAKTLLRMLKKPSKLLMTVKICVNITSLFAAAYTAAYIIGGISASPVVSGIIFVLITLAVILLVMLFGELVPRKIAGEKPDRIAVFAAYPLSVLCTLLSPVTWLLSALTNLFVRMFGIDPDKSTEVVTEEEIRLMVDVGEEKGVIPETEKMMINNIFDFNDTTVSKIMTHRTDVIGIQKGSAFDEIVGIAAAEGYTRLPVYDGTIDNIIGILHTKSLISHLSKSGVKFRIDDYLIKPYFVPQSKLANELFDEMQKQKIHIAVVADEYGGTAGIVTLEDLVESILGNIQDEYDDEEVETQRVDDHTFLVDGSVSLDDVFDMASLEIPEDMQDDFEYDTIGGFCTSLIDKIPENGDVFTFEKTVFEIVDADDKKINKVKVTTSLPDDEDKDE